MLVSALHLRYILYMLWAPLLENLDTNIHKFLYSMRGGEGRKNMYAAHIADGGKEKRKKSLLFPLCPLV